MRQAEDAATEDTQEPTDPPRGQPVTTQEGPGGPGATFLGGAWGLHVGSDPACRPGSKMVHRERLSSLLPPARGEASLVSNKGRQEGAGREEPGSEYCTVLGMGL